MFHRYCKVVFTRRFARKPQDRRESRVIECSSKYLSGSAKAINNAMPGQDIPLWMQQEYQLQDEFQTKSSELVKQTAKDCLPFLFEAIESTPELAKQKHVVFLTNMLGRLPNGYTGLDASRPWILYWTLMALSLLGHEVSRYRESCVSIKEVGIFEFR